LNASGDVIQSKLKNLEIYENRKKTKIVLLCRAIEELRDDLESEISNPADATSSKISDISMT
jgi:hypothetical protein